MSHFRFYEGSLLGGETIRNAIMIIFKLKKFSYYIMK